MAACSDRERVKKSTFDIIPVVPLVQCSNLSENENLVNLKMPKKPICIETKQNNTQNLEALSDDEFQSLLEEATTFNKPINQASALLQNLHKECLDKNKHTLEGSMHRSKKNKASKSKSRGAQGLDSLFADGLLCVNETSSKPQRNEHSNRRRMDLAKEEASLNHNSNWVNDSLKKHDTHSQSLQDLASDHLDSFGRPSLLAGKNSRKHSSVQRASSFSSCSENSKRAVVSTHIDNLKTAFTIKGAKSAWKTSKSETTSLLKNEIDILAANGELSDSDVKENVISSPTSPALELCDMTLNKGDSGFGSFSKVTSPMFELTNSMDVEMQDLDCKNNDNERLYSDEPWLKTKSLHLHNRRKSDSDKGKDFSVEIDARVGFPLKQRDSEFDSLYPLHKSTGDFDHSHYSDNLNNLTDNVETNGVLSKPFKQTSLVPMYDYPNTLNENRDSQRKIKKRPNVENQNIIYSQNIEGHRREQNLEELVKFINSSDKKKASGKTGKSNFTQGTRHSDLDRKKLISNNRVIRSNKNLVNGARKASNNNSEHGSEEDLSYTNHQVETNFNEVVEPMKGTNAFSTSTSTSVSEGDNLGAQDDFYAFPENLSQNNEDEFRVVMHKNKRKRRLVKGDSFRRHNSSTGSNGSILRDLKQDPGRRKSASSMPPSENSSVDNSDLDSVHSLPVNGSVPPPSVRPHTSPSSMSSTPQASYADIARMSLNCSLKLNNNNNNITNNTASIATGLSQGMLPPSTNTLPVPDLSSINNNSAPKSVSNKAETKATKNVLDSVPPKTTNESATRTDLKELSDLVSAIKVPSLETEVEDKEKTLCPPIKEKSSKLQESENFDYHKSIKSKAKSQLNDKPPIKIENNTNSKQKNSVVKIAIPTAKKEKDLSISFGFNIEEFLTIEQHSDANGALVLTDHTPKKKSVTKEPVAVILENVRTGSDSPSSPINSVQASGHLNNSVEDSNYLEIVNFFKSEWNSLQKTAIIANESFFEKAKRCHES